MDAESAFSLAPPLIRDYAGPVESNYEYVLVQLQATKGNWPRVAKAAGIPYKTLKKIATREFKSPGVQSIELLASYFRKSPSAS